MLSCIAPFNRQLSFINGVVLRIIRQDRGHLLDLGADAIACGTRFDAEDYVLITKI